MIKNFSIYFLTNLITKFLIFYLFLYSSHIITTEEYGIIGYSLTIIGFLGAITSLGLSSLVFTHFHNLSEELVNKLKQNIYGIFIFNFIIVNLLLFIFWIFYGKYYENSNYILLIISLSNFLNFFAQIHINELRLKNKIMTLSKLTLLTTLIFCILAFIFMKSSFLVLSMQVLIIGLIFCIVFFKDFKNIKFKNLDFSILRISMPIMMTSLVGVLGLVVDKTMISYYLSLSDLGVYEISLKFAQMYDTLIAQVITLVYLPWMINKLKNDYKKYFNLNIFYSFVLAFFSALIVYIIPDFIWNFIANLVGDDFFASIQYIRYLIYYFILFLLLTMLNIIFIYNKNTKFIFFSSIVILTSNIIFNFYFIPKYGIIGSIISSNLSIFCGIIYILVLYLKKEGQGLNDNKIIE